MQRQQKKKIVLWVSISLLTAHTFGREMAVSQLRLVPFPKEIRLEAGVFSFNRPLVLEVSDGQQTGLKQILEELHLAGIPRPDIQLQSSTNLVIRLISEASPVVAEVVFRDQATEEDYGMLVSPDVIEIKGNGMPGLFYGVQTVCQLIRANRQQNGIPCMRIHDWPSLRYRGFQDDITRGPSPHLSTLEREVRLGAEFKMNFFTYYMEYQYAFKKHPDIGPEDGSLTPEELKSLVDDAQQYSVEIIGCQQSFGHLYNLLKHNEFKDLREAAAIINPVNDASYKLLDDLYSEQIPLLDSKFFNVCCDETAKLGTGPSKDLAEKIGVGGVYAGHMKRIHDIISNKYGKRMMMWGDIILNHPENLADIPKDTIMLTWSYPPFPNFEDKIMPFVDAGYEFFVCPGVSCWDRILPNFYAASINIQNFVRDGANHGALGMLNTTWDDDGENFFSYNWPGVLWGAECAWNASETEPKAFNHRVGAVFFGEESDHFGQAIELMGIVYKIAGDKGLRDQVFWKMPTGQLPANEQSTREKTKELLDAVVKVKKQLDELKVSARVNTDIIDYFVFGTRRIEVMAARNLSFLDVAHDYEQAVRLAFDDSQQARDLINRVVRRLEADRSDHVALKQEYSRLWDQENKPYALKQVLDRFDLVIDFYDKLIGTVRSAGKELDSGRPLPDSQAVGLYGENAE